MVGQVPVRGDLSKDDLSDRLTEKEQLTITQLTGLTVDITPGSVKNMGTFEAQEDQLGALRIVAAGEVSVGTKIISASTVFILGAKEVVDVYRLPV